MCRTQKLNKKCENILPNKCKSPIKKTHEGLSLQAVGLFHGLPDRVTEWPLIS